MSHKDFCHIHLHTEHSLLDGAIRIPELIQYVKEQGMNACSISNHGWMAGVIEFYKECNKNKIKPLIGVEAYITKDIPNLPKEERTRDNNHLILIAKNNIGYQALLELTSKAALENFYYKPRIYKELLKGLSGDVICSTACLAGPLSRNSIFNEEELLTTDPENLALKELLFLKDIFKDDLYLELQDWPNNQQQAYNKFLLQLGRQHNCKFVITSDAHYLKKEDIELHELLMALQMKQSLQEYRESGSMKYGPWFYVKSSEEMWRSVQELECEEAYTNTLEIADKCNVTIQLGKYKLPQFRVSEVDDYQLFQQWLLEQKGNECNG